MHETYKLLDSGAGARLEQLGEIVISRPSSLAIWDQKSPELWDKVDAQFEHKRGWWFKEPLPESWPVSLGGLKLIVRLQSNGQIGLFPEHASYMAELKSQVSSVCALRGKCRVLNLFAYTGLASLTAASAGAVVTHIDSSKKVLDWAKENIVANGLVDSSVRLIPEDAVTFLKREVKRGNRYDIVVADPPSFSRVSAKQEWSLEEVLEELVSLVGEVLDPESKGGVFFASHAYEIGGEVVANLFRQNSALSGWDFEARLLAITESDGGRRLPAGILAKGHG